MSDDAKSTSSARPTPPGLYDRADAGGFGQSEAVAALMSVVWLLLCVLFFLFLKPAGESGLVFVMTAMVVFFPIAMIWVAASATRASRVMREESARLQSAIDAIRKAYIAQNQRGATEPSITRKLDEIAATTRKAEAALAVFTSSRQTTAAPQVQAVQPAETETGDDQPALALGTNVEELAPPLPSEDFIRALNFPETAEDTQGFAALRRALKDRPTAQLVQASQDVLTLMSQDGIYMDDLRPDLARTEIWRAFASGTRGRAIAALGGVRDRTSLALAHGRMKQDPIFRDAAHHFLRIFDKVFAEFAERASDGEIQAFATTRTSRAFMLLGRIAGTFD
ncbi:hypothetical protein [Primorskyibacter sp. S187A]|uniref:hypothetical protein n=1 Tax=Primorskyibacter sp. S187A TaxID=3415130 RepID=UPI003C7C3723